MIIDPESFVPVEVGRRLAAGRGHPGRTVIPPRRRQRRPRGPVLRLAAWATGRTAHI